MLQQNIHPFTLVSTLTFDACSVIAKVNHVVFIIFVNVKVFCKMSISNNATLAVGNVCVLIYFKCASYGNATILIQLAGHVDE